jgi:uncharacterized protein YaaN involved in tellurite resistance
MMSDKDITLSVQESNEKKEPGYNAMVRLSEADMRYAREFSSQIDVSDTKMILQYGYQAQKHVIDFSEHSLSDLPQHDYDEIRDDLNKMKRSIRAFEKEVLSSPQFNTNSENAFDTFKTAYERISSKLSETARRLEIHRSSLLRHHERLEKHYDTCMGCIREYDMYIYAGQLALDKARREQLNELLKRAEKTGLKEDVLYAKDFSDNCTRLEKKLSDLSLSRQLPFQMCTEIRMMQNTDIVFAENLRSLCVNAFPLWKSRIILSYGTGTERYFDPQILKDSNAKLIAACDALIKALSLNRTKRKKGSFFTD